MNSYLNEENLISEQPVSPEEYILKQENERLMKKNAKSELRFLGNMAGLALALVLICQVFLGQILSVQSLNYLYFNNASFRAGISIIGTIMYVGIPFLIIFLFTRLKIKDVEIVPLNSPKFKDVILYVPIGLAACMGINYVTLLIGELASKFGYKFVLPETNIDDSNYSLTIILTLIGTAVMPALIEEFAIRGVILQPLRKYGLSFSIISSSVIFGLMHQNMAQMCFAIAVGICLAFFTVKANSLWIGILIHFFNNLFSVIMDIVQNNVSSAAYTNIFIISVSAICGIGIICFIIMIVKRRIVFSREYGNISCEMEGFLLEFYKQEPTDVMAYPPYKMKITTKCNENQLQAFVSDINSEYTKNTQEENYIKIKERLDRQNMRIAEEEVFDDDTIVLTVDID